MTEAAAASDFERAARWRDKFEQLEWLLAATSRARTAIDLLTFVYRDPGTFGDDRAYVVRRGVVRATYPWPDAHRADCSCRRRRPRAGTTRWAGVAPATRVPRRDSPRVSLVQETPGGAAPHHPAGRIPCGLPLTG